MPIGPAAYRQSLHARELRSEPVNKICVLMGKNCLLLLKSPFVVSQTYPEFIVCSFYIDEMDMLLLQHAIMKYLAENVACACNFTQIFRTNLATRWF